MDKTATNNYQRKPCSQYKDEELLPLIAQGGQASDDALNCLYERYFDMAKMAISYHNMDSSAVLEAYGDALLALRNNIQKGKLEGNGKLRAYFAMTFKFKCIDNFRKSTTIHKEAPIENRQNPDFDQLTPEELSILQEEETEAIQLESRRRECLELAISELSPREREVLQDFYVAELKASVVAEKHAFKSARVVSSTAINYKRKLQQAILNLCRDVPKCNLLCVGA